VLVYDGWMHVPPEHQRSWINSSGIWREHVRSSWNNPIIWCKK
jgi:hypothetical protein